MTNLLKPYKCELFPGKGIGVRAQRDIGKGELLLDEFPVLYYVYKEHGDALYKYEAFSKFKNLSIGEQEDIMKLENSKPDVGEMVPELEKMFNEDPKFKKWLGIMVTNQVKLKENSRGLFLNASRFNHNCVPNANYETLGSNVRISAVRNILKGEELCISYIRDPYCFEVSHNKHPTIENIKDYLKFSYGFDCICELCSMNEEQREEIDRHRMKYMELYNRIDGFPTLSDSNQLNLLLELFEEMEKGKVFSLDLTSHYAIMGFRSAMICKDYKNSDYFINKAYDAKLIAEGEESPTTKQYFSMLHDRSKQQDYIDKYMETL